MIQTLKNLLEKAWHHRREFFKYFIVGITAFVLDTGSLYLLKEKAQFSAVSAIAVSQPFILVFVFFTNKFWSFGVENTKKESTKQIVKFLTLALGNYLFGLAWMWVMHHELNLNYLVARVANIVLAVGWNFLLYKYWVYKTEPVHNNPILTP